MLIIALAGTVYVWLGGAKTLPSTTTGTDGESTAIQLAQLRKLRDLRLDTDILEDEFFKSLSPSQAIPVLQQDGQGRINPFLPL